MKLSKILKNEKLSYLKLLTKNTNLEKEIETIESTETPDVHNYINKNSLIITTAMTFKNNQEELINFIDHLKEKEAVGIAIKIGRFLKNLDEKIIDHCNNIDFPLLKIPDEITLGTVYQDVLSEIWDYEEDNLTFALNSQKIFSSLLLQKPNLSVILHTLKSVLDVEVGLIDPFGNIESCTNYFSPLFSKGQLRKVVKNKLDEPKMRFKEDVMDTTGDIKTVFIHKINISAYYPYYLFVLSSDKLDVKMSKFIIDQAMFAIAFTISSKLNNRHYELQKLERNFRDFIHLASEDKERELLQIMQRENIQLYQKGRNVIISLPKFQKLFPYHLQQEGYTLIYDFFQNKISKMINYKLIPLIFEHYYLIQSEETNIETLIRDFNRVSKDLKNALNIDTEIAIGPKYFSYKSMVESIEDTIEAVTHGTPHKKNKNVKISRPQNYKKLFALIPESQREFFFESTLKGLANNTDTAKELRETLKSWLLNRANTQKTADELYVHRNTVNYRLEKCREILDSELTDKEELYNLEIALTLFD